jgi:hypothetical protein
MESLKRLREAGDAWVDAGDDWVEGKIPVEELMTAKKQFMSCREDAEETSTQHKTEEAKLVKAGMTLQADIELYETAIGLCKEKKEDLSGKRNKLISNRERCLRMLSEINEMLPVIEGQMSLCDTSYMESLVVDHKAKQRELVSRLQDHRSGAKAYQNTLSEIVHEFC